MQDSTYFSFPTHKLYTAWSGYDPSQGQMNSSAF